MKIVGKTCQREGPVKHFCTCPGKWTSLDEKMIVNGGIPAHAINSEYVLLSEE